MHKTIFITGATGNIGGKLVARILQADSDSRLILLVRGKDICQARQRVLHIISLLSPELDLAVARSRMEIVLGDINVREFGLSATQIARLTGEVSHIIHSAASTQFTLPLECARLTNVNGTATVLKFARQAREFGRLQGLAHLSTAFVCGDRDGIIYENSSLSAGQFANAYEQSKWEAEQLVAAAASDIPLAVFRPSIVVGDSDSGRTTAFNVLYSPLRLIHQRVITGLPCAPDTPLDVVPVNYVSDAVCHIFLSTRNWPGKIYHLVAGRRQCTTVGHIVDGAVAYFNRCAVDEPLPLINFDLFHSSGGSLLSEGKLRRMRELLKVYEPYICAKRIFDDANTQAALRGSGIFVPKLPQYMDRLLAYSLQTNWGRHVRHAA